MMGGGEESKPAREDEEGEAKGNEHEDEGLKRYKYFANSKKSIGGGGKMKR